MTASRPQIRKDLATKDPRYASIEHATVLLYSWFNREKMRYEALQKDMRYTVETSHWLLDVRGAAALRGDSSASASATQPVLGSRRRRR